MVLARQRDLIIISLYIVKKIIRMSSIYMKKNNSYSLLDKMIIVILVFLAGIFSILSVVRANYPKVYRPIDIYYFPILCGFIIIYFIARIHSLDKIYLLYMYIRISIAVPLVYILIRAIW